MPRVITEELVACGIGISWEEGIDVDPADGQIRKGMDGLPKKTRIAVIVIHDTLPNGIPHITRIPLNGEGRQTLIQELTGGITIPELTGVH